MLYPSTGKLSNETDRQSSSSKQTSINIYPGGITYVDTPPPLRVKLHEPTFGEEEIDAVVEVMRSTQITSGEKVREFEKAFGGDHAVMCNSGSSANLLAIAGLCAQGRLKAGDEVIVSALSWSTTIWPLVQYGLIPKIVDIDPETLNIDVAIAKEAIGPKTKAIMPVHVYGNPCDMEALLALDLILIEDCCEALGASYKLGEQDISVGTFGDIATFSFYFSHHITTGEGGICVARDADLAEQIRILRAHGWTRDMNNPESYHDDNPEIDPRFLFVAPGYNLRCTEMQGAMGLVQLPKLKGFVEDRRRAAERLSELFGRYPRWLSTQKETGYSSWFGFPLVINHNAPFTAKVFCDYLRDCGIESRSIICGNIARQPGIKNIPHLIHGDLQHSDHVMKQGFSIPCHQNVTSECCDFISESVNEFMFLRGYD